MGTDPAGATRHTTTVDGATVSFLAAGDPAAPPVVLLHGGGVDAAAFSWRDVLPALADEHRVLAPDLPGYGESARGTVDPTTDGYVRWLDDLLDALALDSVALAGISLGGGVALGYALDHPDRVSRLVLVDSYGLGHVVPGGRLAHWFVHVPGVTRLTWAALRRSRWLTGLAFRAVTHPDAVTDALIDDAHALVRRPGAGDTFHDFQRAEVGPRGLRTDYTGRLPELAVPTLLVHGADDPLVPVAWARRAHDRIPDATLHVVPDCGHVAPRERPEAVTHTIRTFLAAPTA